MMMLLVLAAGLGLGLSLVAFGAIVTGRWQPEGAAVWARIAQFAGRLWAGPYRRSAHRRAHRQRVVAGLVLAMLIWLIAAMPAVALAAMLAVPGVPWLLGGARLERAAIERLAAIHSWTQRLTDLVVTGTGLQQSIIASADTAPAEIADEVNDLAVRLKAGHDPRESLHRLADDLDDTSADAVVASLLQHVATKGTGLRDALTDVAATTANQISDRHAVYAERGNARSTLTGLTYLTAAVMVAGPLLGNFGQAYATGAGQITLFACLGLLVGLLLYARKLTVPRRAVRLLTPADQLDRTSTVTPELEFAS